MRVIKTWAAADGRAHVVPGGRGRAGAPGALPPADPRRRGAVPRGGRGAGRRRAARPGPGPRRAAREPCARACAAPPGSLTPCRAGPRCWWSSCATWPTRSAGGRSSRCSGWPVGAATGRCRLSVSCRVRPGRAGRSPPRTVAGDGGRRVRAARCPPPVPACPAHSSRAPSAVPHLVRTAHPATQPRRGGAHHPHRPAPRGDPGRPGDGVADRPVRAGAVDRAWSPAAELLVLPRMVPVRPSAWADP